MPRGTLYETRKQSVNCYITTYNRVPATSPRRLLGEEYANVCVKRDVRPTLRGITLRFCHAQYQEREREREREREVINLKADINRGFKAYM